MWPCYHFSTASVSLPLAHALKNFAVFLSYCLKARFWLSSELYKTNSYLRVAAQLFSIVHWSLTFQGNRCNQLVDSMYVSQLSYKKTMYNSDVSLQKSHITLTKCGVEITNNSREKWNSLSVSVPITVSSGDFEIQIFKSISVTFQIQIQIYNVGHCKYTNTQCRTF